MMYVDIFYIIIKFLNGKEVMLILFLMKKKEKFKFYDYVFVVIVIYMNIII